MDEKSQNTNNDASLPLTPRITGPVSTKLVLFAFVTLLAGMVIGSASTIIIIRTARIDPSKNPEQSHKKVTRAVQRDLRLTPEQSAQIGPIIDKHMRVLWHIRMGVRPIISEQLKAMREEVAPLLNENQQKLWQRQVKGLQMRLQYQPMNLTPGQPGPGQRRPQQGRRRQTPPPPRNR